MDVTDTLTETGAAYIVSGDCGGWTITLTDEKGAEITLTDLTLTDLTLGRRKYGSYPYTRPVIDANLTRGTFEIDLTVSDFQATAVLRMRDAGTTTGDLTDLIVSDLTMVEG